MVYYHRGISAHCAQRCAAVAVSLVVAATYSTPRTAQLLTPPTAVWSTCPASLVPPCTARATLGIRAAQVIAPISAHVWCTRAVSDAHAHHVHAHLSRSVAIQIIRPSKRKIQCIDTYQGNWVMAKKSRLVSDWVTNTTPTPWLQPGLIHSIDLIIRSYSYTLLLVARNFTVIVYVYIHTILYSIPHVRSIHSFEVYQRKLDHSIQF